jgi:ABC transporter substrate binding protein
VGISPGAGSCLSHGSDLTFRGDSGNDSELAGARACPARFRCGPQPDSDDVRGPAGAHAGAGARGDRHQARCRRRRLERGYPGGQGSILDRADCNVLLRRGPSRQGAGQQPRPARWQRDRRRDDGSPAGWEACIVAARVCAGGAPYRDPERPPASQCGGTEEAQRVARELGLETDVFYADEPADYVAAFAGMRTARSEALIILSAPDFFRDAALLSRLALEAGLPTVCEWASMARDGCLIGYGPNYDALWRRPADYVARILRGDKPGELPIEQPALFEFAVNLKTAKALGLTIPESALQRADEVFE